MGREEEGGFGMGTCGRFMLMYSKVVFKRITICLPYRE